MAKVSPAQNVFEGEFSPLSEGRTDIERYGRAMRYMSNMVPCRTGPAIGRSGTYFEQRCAEITQKSKLLPFEFNENETLILEFSHFKLRFLYEYNGVAAHREVAVSAVSAVNPFTFTAVGHDVVIGESVTFRDFPGAMNVNGVIAKVTNVVGNVITTDWVTNTVLGLGSATMAVVYEIATPWHRDDIDNLRIVQALNTCYLFCTKADGSADYRPQILYRYDTFSWAITQFPLVDGPYMDVNTTSTFFLPTGNGTWLPNMTSAVLPTGAASADSEITGHEAWRAFDDNLDSYWEANTPQQAILMYAFETGFADVLPTFTASVTGGMTVTATSQVTGQEAWKAADLDVETGWRANAALPQEWRIDLGAAMTLREYRIRAFAAEWWYAPRDFTLEGSNTAGFGGPWTVVDTRVGITWAGGQRIHFTAASPGNFRYYRLRATALNRKVTSTIVPATGTPGTKGYVARHTVTTTTANTAGFAEIEFSTGSGTPRIVDGYTIYLSRYNKGIDMREHAPRIWYFEGFDGANWQLLDSQNQPNAWGTFRSPYFPIQNADAYSKYRLRIQACMQSGSDINPRIGKLVMSSPDAPTLSLRASSTTGINDNQGFLSTDVGRLIRVYDADSFWRWLIITAVTTPIRVSLQSLSKDPIVLERQVTLWRLGLWSDTTGWPTCGTLHEDRLFCGGVKGFPDYITGSKQGIYHNFQASLPDDEVLDHLAIVTRALSRFLSRIVWMKSAEEGLRIGTGKGEYVLSAPVQGALSARNFQVRQTTKRGSAVHEPASVDNDVVFLQKSGRQLYALAFQPGQSGVAAAYKSALVSKLGSHLMSPPVQQVVYQQEPHGVIWGRRSDGSVVAMSYSNDDDTFGGHRHDFSGVVVDLCPLYSPTDRQDSLWMVVKRTISAVDVYYIERLYHFWDFPDTLSVNGTFVDCALRYYGTDPTAIVYGLRHLEGKMVSVLADKIVYKNVGPVVNGSLVLERAATDIVVGLPYVMEAEIIAPEVGAEDGTAQGKSKRPHSVVLRLWQSANGEVGRWNEDQNTLEYTPVEYNIPPANDLGEITPVTCLTKTIVLPAGYGTLGTVRFRQTDPLPFNVAGVYPQSYVEDER